MKKIRTKIMFIFILLLGIGLVKSPIFSYIRSLTVMSVYSNVCKEKSIMKKEKFALEIPGGLKTKEKDWYPFVMTYVADQEFSEYIGKEGMKLTVLYNFPAFDLKNGCSNLFDNNSPYYNGFYGAYLVQQPDGGAYGIDKDKKINHNTISEIAKFDIFTLVLEEFGLRREGEIFRNSISMSDTDYRIAEIDGWSRISSDLLVNGVAHNSKKGVMSYLQYGTPLGVKNEEFTPIEMKSVIYGRYFKEYHTTIFLYVMARNEKICQACENTFLNESVIKGR